MRDTGRKPKTQGLPFIDRQVQRIANARSVTVGLAIVFLALAIVGAIVMRIVDPHDFPTLGLAAWWSLQTVTRSATATSFPRPMSAGSSAASSS